ncbi:nitrile hydratase accessory protein [Pseudarthrobacter sp. NPDC058329]|uniref:nitrile hydratase accessory protein n=1 Tax=Pseudarthrobacter sp. NPDC058329 TaxID=3346448 RepID=UPI0036D76697
MANCEIISEETIKDIHSTDARASRAGEEAFRLPWELRSFALGVAYYESDHFPWNDFQSQLITAINEADEDNKPEHYYARWVEALESLLKERGGFDPAELDRRTKEILDTPRDSTHSHEHPHPAPEDDHNHGQADHH